MFDEGPRRCGRATIRARQGGLRQRLDKQANAQLNTLQLAGDKGGHMRELFTALATATMLLLAGALVSNVEAAPMSGIGAAD
jgi:hypothetical protein